jgi:Ca2+-binding EF-hand superfamily protein
MISGIGSSDYYSSYLRNQAMGRSDPSEMFETTDTDDSGGISQSELESWIGAMSEETGSGIDTTDAVSTFDADGDGELNEDELGSFMSETMPPPPGIMGMGPEAPAENLFQALDTDSSSGISLSELSEWADAMSDETGEAIDSSDALSEYDIDGDGELSSSELDSFLTASGIGGPSSNGTEAESTTTASSGGSSGSTSSAISEYDTNEDGVLSAAELQAYLDDIEEKNPTFRMQEAISNYSMNHFNDNSFSTQDVFMNMGETGGYSPIDISG